MTGGAFILAADTAVAVGRRILPKAETPEDAADCLVLLSGRSHRVFTGLCLLTPKGRRITKVVDTKVRFSGCRGEDIGKLARLRRMARQGRRLW